MITISVSTLLAVLGLLVTIVLAALGALWKLAVQMGEFRSTLDGLTKAVEHWADLAERIAALEALQKVERSEE